MVLLSPALCLFLILAAPVDRNILSQFAVSGALLSDKLNDSLALI